MIHIYMCTHEYVNHFNL